MLLLLTCMRTLKYFQFHAILLKHNPFRGITLAISCPRLCSQLSLCIFDPYRRFMFLRCLVHLSGSHTVQPHSFSQCYCSDRPLPSPRHTDDDVFLLFLFAPDLEQLIHF